LAIKRIQEIPSELPHAHLYLDDVEEISTILRDAYERHERTETEAINKKLALLGSQPTTQPERVVRIQYKSGDSQMDTIQDLQSRGGSATDLEIVVDVSFGGGVSFRGTLNPVLHCHTLGSEQSWGVYGKVRSVFDHRPLRLRNTANNLPLGLKFLFYILFLLVPGLFPAGRLWASQILLLWGAYLILAIGLAYTVLRPSRVFFTYSHERSRASSQAWSRSMRDIFMLVTGAVIVKLVEQLFRHLFSK